jgi:hypothetical protein
VRREHAVIVETMPAHLDGWITAAREASKRLEDILCISVHGHEPTGVRLIDVGDLPEVAPTAGVQ